MQDNRFKLIFASIPKGVHISCVFFKNDSLFNKHSVIAYKKKKKKAKSKFISFVNRKTVCQGYSFLTVIIKTKDFVKI